MKFALVQGFPDSHGLVVKLASTIDELLELPFHYNPAWSAPRIYTVGDDVVRDETGARLIREIELLTRGRRFTTLKVPL